MARDFPKEMARMLDIHGGLYTVEDIFEHLQSGKMQSFAEGDTWVITQVNQFPRKKVLEVVFVIGDLETLHKISPRLDAYREEIGADFLMATGRLGWLRRHFEGWKPLSVNYIKV